MSVRALVSWESPKTLLVLLALWFTAFAVSRGGAQRQVPLRQDAWPEIQLRIAWGGGESRLWRGDISVSQGQVIKKRLLGIEADEPRAMWQDNASIGIEQPRPRTYDGVDVTVIAPLDATLQLDLTPADGQPNEVPVVRIPVSEMLTNYYNGQLDDRGNRLLVRRESGDILRLNLEQPSLILQTGQPFRATMQPYLLPTAAGSQIQLRTSVTRARDSEELWTQRRTVALDATGSSEPISLEFQVPDEEGAFDLHVEALQSNLGARIGIKQTIAKRTLQFLVFNERGPVPGVRASNSDWSEVLTIDLANPDWWSNLTRWPIVGSAAQPQSSGHRTVAKLPTAQGEFAFSQLEPSQEDSISWESVPLKVEDVGRPHILEVDFPADAPQNLGISILEPNAAGRLVPIGLDSGAYQSESSNLPRRGELASHRLVFWPRTRQPLLLITNQSTSSECYFGEIRVRSGPEHLPTAFTIGTSAWEAERDWLAYFEKPLLSENFGATEFVDEWSGRSLDDWRTFHEATGRMGEYLAYRGQTGAIVTVATDGSALFPSETLPPTPRFDTGAFFDTSQDPQAKDILELLLREFDRRELKLIPAIDFATSLPSLEQLARNGDPSTASLFWIGGDGRWLLGSQSASRGRAPYYNILDPRVQDALLSVIREVARRAGRHNSFSGLAIRLGADGYAQLPGPEWGFDDLTIARFEQQTGINLAIPNTPERFAHRKELMLGQHREAWLAWRAEQLHLFYGRAAADLRQIRPDAKLYLLGTGILASPESRTRFHPASAGQGAVARSLLEAGIGPALIAGSEGLTFLQPQRIRPTGSLAIDEIATADEYIAVNAQDEFSQIFANAPGSIFFHPPTEFRIPTFEESSPIEGTSAWVVSQMSPSGANNQERFVHALAQRDQRLFVDGGWLVPMGQDEGLRRIMATYRQLPDAPFETLNKNRTQPVVIRTWKKNDAMCLYLVNDSPWRAQVSLKFRSSSDVRAQTIGEFSTSLPLRATADQTTTQMELDSYDLQAVWIRAADLRIEDISVVLPHAPQLINSKLTELRARLNRLSAQAPSRVAINNGGFENYYPSGAPLGWQPSPGSTLVQLQGENLVHDGTSAAIMRCNSGRASLVSDPLPIPDSGRLAVSAWLKIPHNAKAPLTRIAIVGEVNGQAYYRYAPVQPSETSTGLNNEWQAFVFHVQDLPTSGLTNLRVQFDLMEPGELAIDDVRVYDRLFDQQELIQIAAMLSRAKISAEKGAWTDCLQVLDGYGPRFLAQHAPTASEQVAESSGNQTTEDASTSRSGILDQVLPDWIKWR